MTSLLDELRALELRLADPAARATPAAIAALLADDFREHGASGTVYDRAAALAALAAAPGAAPIAIEACAVRELGPDHALVTYRARTAAGASLRSSIWARQGGAWRIVFHQGTPVPAGSDA